MTQATPSNPSNPSSPATPAAASPEAAPLFESGTRLSLTPRHLEHIHAHACRTYPEECCGVLMGKALREAPEDEDSLPLDRGGIVEQAMALENEREDSRHNRYIITPESVLRAHRQANELGLDILGYYHSHPDHPAIPSEFDREHAWPGMSYLITSVEQGKIADTRSWRLTDDRNRFDEESLDIVPSMEETEPQEVAE